MSTLVERLQAGRDRIARGFCKHAASEWDYKRKKEVAWCAVGAVRLNTEAVEALYPQLPTEFQTVHENSRKIDVDRSKWSAVVTYNNHPDTTQADMVALFEKTLAEHGGLS